MGSTAGMAFKFQSGFLVYMRHLESRLRVLQIIWVLLFVIWGKKVLPEKKKVSFSLSECEKEIQLGWERSHFRPEKRGRDLICDTQALFSSGGRRN